MKGEPFESLDFVRTVFGFGNRLIDLLLSSYPVVFGLLALVFAARYLVSDESHLPHRQCRVSQEAANKTDYDFQSLVPLL